MNHEGGNTPVEEVEGILRVRLPRPYHQGFAETPLTITGPPDEDDLRDEIRLWMLEEIVDLNQVSGLPERLPGLVLIGDDGARERLALDTRTSPARVVLVDVVFQDWSDAILQTADLETLLREFPSQGLRWE